MLYQAGLVPGSGRMPREIDCLSRKVRERFGFIPAAMSQGAVLSRIKQGGLKFGEFY